MPKWIKEVFENANQYVILSVISMPCFTNKKIFKDLIKTFGNKSFYVTYDTPGSYLYYHVNHDGQEFISFDVMRTPKRKKTISSLKALRRYI